MSIETRIKKLEQGQKPSGPQGQTIYRFTHEGTEYVQIYWNGEPSGKVMQAWMWDAWPNSEHFKGELA